MYILIRRKKLYNSIKFLRVQIYFRENLTSALADSNA